jgi:hypothetical protein
MRWTLWLAGIYNLAWGAWVILRPHDLFDWTGIARPNYPGIWQCVGMIVGVYGIGYWIAARDPFRHWPIVLVGFLGKLFGPIGMVSATTSGELPYSWFATIVTNDLVWWIPFALILFEAAKESQRPTATEVRSLRAALEQSQADDGRSLASITDRGPTMLVFLRHAGCTFCRQTLASLAKQRRDLAAEGITQVVVIHQSPLVSGRAMLDRYGLKDLPQVSDPQCYLYRSVGFGRGTFGQLFGPRVWWRGFVAAIIQRHGLGTLDGDGFQLGGTVVIDRGQIVRADPHPTAADQTDFCALAGSRS